MSTTERILEQMRDMPEQVQQQVLDFAMFLKEREKRALDALMDQIITEDEPALKELAK